MQRAIGADLRTWLVRWVILLAAAAGIPEPACGQGNPAARAAATAADADLHVEDVEAQRTALAGIVGISDQARQDAVDNLSKAIEAIRQAATLAEDAAKFERSRSGAAGELEVAKAEAAQPIDTQISPPPDATIEQLRQARDQAEANLAIAQARIKTLDDEQAQRAARKAEIPTILAKLQEESEEINRALAAIDGQTTSDEPPALVAARRTWLQARRMKITNQVAALGRELASNDARTEFFQVQRELAARKVAAFDHVLKDWRDEVVRTEKRQAARDAAEARQKLEEQQPAVKLVAQENVRLAEMLSGSASAGQGLVARKSAAESQLEELAKKVQSQQERFARELRIGRVADLTEVIDVRLRQIRDELPNVASLRENLNERRREFTEVQQQLADLEYKRDSLPDIDARKRALMDGLSPGLDAAGRESVSKTIDELLRKQQELYATLIGTCTIYADILLRLQAQESQLIETTGRFASYIDERILWIRSMPPVSAADIPKAAQSLAYLASPRSWRGAAAWLWEDAASHSAVIGAWIIVFMVLFIVKRRLARRLGVISDLVSQVYTDRFALTLRALFITILLAYFWPAVFWFVAWRLDAPGSPEFNRVVAAGMNRAATILVTIQVLRQLCKPNGLGESHFRWLDSTRRLIMVNLRWIVVVVPVSFVVAAVEADRNDDAQPVLGRVAFMIGMLAVAAFTVRILNPRHHILDPILRPDDDSWLFRLRNVLYWSIVGLPLALLVTAAMGYYYTALQLNHRLVSTFWLIQFLVVFNGLVLRWLVIAKRRLAIDDARKRRNAHGQADGGAAIATAETAVVLEEPKIDLDVINEQTRRLLRSAIAFGLVLGIWAVWVGMLPALGIFKRIEIYPHFARVNEIETASAFGDAMAGQAPPETAVSPSPPAASALPSITDSSSPAPRPLPGAGTPLGGALGGDEAAPQPDSAGRAVTLADLIRAALFLIVTVVLSRNLPGLLEITVLPQMPLDASGRFAVATIARYIVSILGVILAFGALGIGWTQVQWLAAAITLGIGFGLQEIFANFISGIILLFEQPIRVGDIVTIKGNEGTVSRIRMRATTITDYDRREIIIPNKDLITGQIMNWTLSDTTHRLVFAIGVAYGSDTALVERTLRSVAAAHPLVMRMPAPQVVFARMGESTLEFSLRAYIANLDNGLTVRHELNIAIDQAFRAAGIEVAYPQRDVHVRSLPDSLRGAAAGPSST